MDDKLDKIIDKLHDLHIQITKVEEKLNNDLDDMKELKPQVEGLNSKVKGVRIAGAIIAGVFSLAMTYNKIFPTGLF